MNHNRKMYITFIGIILLGLLAGGCASAAKDGAARAASTPAGESRTKVIPGCADGELTAEEIINRGVQRYSIEQTSTAASCAESEKPTIINENPDVEIDVWFGCIPSAAKTFKHTFLRYGDELFMLQEVGENTYRGTLHQSDVEVVFGAGGYELRVDTREDNGCVYTYEHAINR